MKKIYILSLFCLFFKEAKAQDNKKFELSAQDISLNEKAKGFFDFEVVSASRTEESSKKAPATIRVITEEEIRLRGYRSLLDVLKEAGGFKIDDLVVEEWRVNSTMSGISGNQNIIILQDGVRISSPTNEPIPIAENYPLNHVKQIEIIYGPASALYGADALAGIINIITRNSDKTNTAEASVAMGDNNYQNFNLFLSKKFAPDVQLSIGGQYFFDKQPNMPNYYPQDYDLSGMQTGSFKTNFGTMQPKAPFTNSYEAPLNAYALFAKLKIKEFKVSFFKNYSGNSSALGNSPQNAIYNKDVLFGHHVGSLDMSYTKNLEKVSLVSSLQGSWYEIDPKSNFRNLFVDLEPAYKYGASYMIKFDQQLLWQANSKTNVMLGFTYEKFKSEPKTADLQDPVDPNREISGFYIGTAIPMKFFQVAYSNIGTFAQVQYSPSPNLHFTLGSRFDYNSRFGGVFNPRLGMVWQPNKNTSIKALYGKAFMAPPPYYAYSSYGSLKSNDGGKTYSSGFFHLPNPNLQPINLQKFELFASRIIQENISIGVNMYYQTLTGLFSNQDDAKTTKLYNNQFLGWKVDYLEVTVNQGNQSVWGLSLLLDYVKNFKDGKLNAFLNADYIDGNVEVVKGEVLPLPIISPFQLKTGFSVVWKNFSFSPRLIWQGTQRLPNLDADKKNRQTAPSYAVLNIMTRYTYKNLALFVDIRNATDTRYRNIPVSDGAYFMGGIPQAPIRFIGGIEFRF